MCGIAGIVAPHARRFSGALERAMATMAHRGPDGRGVHAFDGCLLGHLRLAIVDVEGGRQPMLTPDGSVGIAFNGAIYGFREIRRSLEPEIAFRTTSDTEVILALYRKYGTRLLDHLPGMFAFAIWDAATRTLFAARDRFGEKPLYFATGPEGEIVFASEIKAILASGLVTPELDRISLAHYLERRYVPVDRTIWNGIHVLPPAHSLTIRDGAISIDRYWTLPAVTEPVSVDDAIDEFRERLERTVATHLVADVPVTAFLSGGLDSSTIVSIAARMHPGLRTIALRFGEPSELPYAREIADRYETDHVELDDRDVDFAELLSSAAEIFDEPHAEPADLATLVVAREVRKTARVVLTGEGGDELLAGYRHLYLPYLEMEPWYRRKRFITGVASFAERMANRLRIPHDHPFRRPFNGASEALRHETIARAHQARRGYFEAPLLARLGLESHVRDVSHESGTVNDALRHDLLDLLPGNWLVRTDRASMSTGVELRSPFLDVGFAGFCASLPSRLKITRDETKWILRRAYEHAWTPAIRRRPKRGFNPDWAYCLKRPEVASIRRRILDDPTHRLYEVIPFSEVRKMTESHWPRTWIIVVLGLWAERWMR